MIFNRIILLVTGALMLVSSNLYGQGEQTFTSAVSSDYNVDGNWVGVSGMVVPDATLGDEFSAIGSNTPDPVSSATFQNVSAVLTSSAPPTGRLILGFGGGATGTLDIASGGSIVVAVGSTTRNGEVVVGGGSQGSMLNISGTGSITADLFTVTGGNTLSINGSNATVDVLGNLSLAGTYVAEITNASTHSRIDVTGTATLSGALNVDLSAVPSPSVGDSWELIQAGTVAGNFGAVNLIGNTSLGAGRGLTTRTVDNGSTTSVEVFLEQFLTLQVDRTTGTLAIQNNGPAVAASDVNIDGYTIVSASNRLSPGAWNSLDDQDLGGAGTWTESNPSVGRLSELRETGATLLAGQSSLGLGAARISPTQFGQGDDFVFQYTAPDGGIRTGLVEYVGDANTLVLQVDPTTGAARVVNQSPFSVAIDGYTITSDDGALLTSWNSLDDQNGGGGDWLESNPSSSRISELKETDSLVLNNGDSFDLGTLYNHAIGSGEGDLVFEFLVNEPVLEGDFDGDGDADGSDFLTWQRNDGTADGLSNWQADFGGSGGGSGAASVATIGEVQFVSVSLLSSTSAVPEPNSLFMILFAAGLGFFSRCRTCVAYNASDCFN